MPTSDGRIGHRDICTSAVVERVIGPGSVSSLKISASLQSDNFVAGTSGWKIERDTGSAEFQDVIVRGTLNADDITTGTLSADRIAADTITVDKLAAGTIGTHVLKLSNAVGSRIESNDGTSMIIRGDGTAVFTNISVTGGAVGGGTVGSGIAAGNITTGSLSADRIATASITTTKLEVTASLVAGQTVESTTYTAGSAGWQIDADGSAEFDNVIVRGTIEASSIEGNVTLGTCGVFRTASSGQRVEITDADPDSVFFYTGDSFEAGPGGALSRVSGAGATRTLQTELFAPVTTGDTGGAYLLLRTESNNDSATPPGIVTGYQAGGGSTQTPEFIVQNGLFGVTELGTAAAPAIGIGSNHDDGIYSSADGKLSISLAGVEIIRWTSAVQQMGQTTGNVQISPASYTFQSDTDTNINRVSANVMGFVAGGSRYASVMDDGAGNVGLRLDNHNTTAAAANTVIDGANILRKSTSSLKYKEGWRFLTDEDLLTKRIPEPITWVDEIGQTRIGWGAEHIAEAFPEATENENYDLRAIVAVQGARLNRLETLLSEAA